MFLENYIAIFDAINIKLTSITIITRPTPLFLKQTRPIDDLISYNSYITLEPYN